MGQYWSASSQISGWYDELGAIDDEFEAQYDGAIAKPSDPRLRPRHKSEVDEFDTLMKSTKWAYKESMPQMIDYEEVFLHNPVSMYLLAPKEDQFRIIGANYAYLSSINRSTHEIIGHPVFDIFPDNPELGSIKASNVFRNSLEYVTETKKELILPNFLHYDVKSSSAGDSPFQEKHWSIIIKPILHEGKIKVIMVKTVDVTETVIAKRATESEKLKADDLMKRVVEINAELMEKSKSLHSANENLKIINQQLEVSMEAVKVSSKAKADFLANISHEMRTPLNAIIGFSELLDKDVQLAGNHHEFIRCIYDAGHHLLGLINDLLDLAKMDAGKLSLNPQATNLVEVLSNATAMVSAKCIEKGIDLRTNIDPEVPKLVLADALRVRQMVINLLSNSVKFTETGFISLDCKVLRLTEESVKLRVDVIDTGIGITEMDQQNLFVRYEQVGTRQIAGGTGLGLPITRELVRLMGGEISVNSSRGLGSTFSLIFSLPILKEVIEKTPEKTYSFVMPQFAACPILIVDDIDMNWGFDSFLRTFPGHPSLICSAEPLQPCPSRFKGRGLFGIVRKIGDADRAPADS